MLGKQFFIFVLIILIFAGFTYAQCADGFDNDQDGFTDLDDPSCSSSSDLFEWPIDSVDPVCSNGVVEQGEECDDGNKINGDGCSDKCKKTTQCNDGVDNDVDGFLDMTDPSCIHMSGNFEWPDDRVKPFCSNGVVEQGEECDDGNKINGDGCSKDCKITTQCNDGIDNDFDGFLDSEDPSCIHGNGNFEWPDDRVKPFCSNGVVEQGEECDDGNKINGDGCSKNCKITTQCNDGIDNDQDGFTDLDDPACHNGTFEWPDNRVDPVCNNGIVETDEDCDAGDQNGIACAAGYNEVCTYCSASCSHVTNRGGFCGDGTINGDETCDGSGGECTVDGYRGTRTCSTDCKSFGSCVATESCGDGVVNGPETCDGSSESCMINGYVGSRSCASSCMGFGSCQQTESCGDGVVNGPETCDGGSLSCTTADGYAGASLCLNSCGGYGGCVATESCGDGIINGNEVCDGSINSCLTADGYSGISFCSLSCSGFSGCSASEVCGDGIINGPEVCDGSAVSCVTSDGYLGTASCSLSCGGFDSCVASESCGDGTINGNEVCDDGSSNGMPNSCNNQCSGITVGICGNSVVEVGEECDDGNLDDSDSCSSSCRTIACQSHSDCGDNFFSGEAVCKSDDVIREFKYFSCTNPGTQYASCEMHSEDAIFDNCEFGCSHGVCLDRRPVELESNLHVSRISLGSVDKFTLDDSIAVSVTLTNQGELDFNDVGVLVVLYDLGLYFPFGSFDISDDDTVTERRVFELPYDIAPGRYDARVVISNDNVRRVVHREVLIV